MERVLFLEADRMASLIVDEANFKSERDVVKEEYRSRVANAPYGELIKNVLSLAYPVGHPYDHPRSAPFRISTPRHSPTSKRSTTLTTNRTTRLWF
jgi:hypothetical protein